MTTIAPEAAIVDADIPGIPKYRQVIRAGFTKEEWQEMTKPDWSSLWWLPVHMVIIGACLWALSAHFSWFLAPVLSLVIGHSMACLGFWSHEVAHGGTVKNLFLRDVISGIGFSAFGISPALWRRWHNGDHHSHTQVEGIDPDHLFTMDYYERNPILQLLYKMSPLARNLTIFTSFSYRMNQQTIRMALIYTVKKKDVPISTKLLIWGQVALQWAGWIGLTLALGTQVFWWGWFVPLLIANTIVISYIVTNHFLNPLGDERDVVATSLTVTLPKWLSWLDVWHSAFGAHVAHHLFPQVSCRYARKIEAKTAELYPGIYQSMPIMTALKALWDTPWIYENPTTFINPRTQDRVPTLGHGLEDQIKKG